MPADADWMHQALHGNRKTFWMRAKEDPLVPLGCAATALILAGGLVTFYHGQSRLGNVFMQARVLAQGATVAALAVGATWTAAGTDDSVRRKPPQRFEDRMDIKLHEQPK
jgi:hypothetical protein